MLRLCDLIQGGPETFVPVEEMNEENRIEWARRQSEFEAKIVAEVEADPDMQPGTEPEALTRFKKLRPKNKNLRRILTTLRRRRKPTSTGDLAKACNTNGSSVSEICYRLCDMGLVRRVGFGTWEAT
jgi:hypothetical protein